MAGLRADPGHPPLSLPGGQGTLRVRVLNTKAPVRLDATGSYQFQSRRGGKIYSSKTAMRVRASRSTLVFGHQSLKGDVLVMPLQSTETLRLNGRRYRGVLVFHPLGNSRYDVVEYVPFEEYLYGVLPREVDARWPSDALKAQAVVSRTYALSNQSRNASVRFDLSDSVLDQVYGGMEAEAPAASRAVDDTRGEILVDSQGKPLQAFFHSSCGGRTELPPYVWKSTLSSDGFASVSDPFCQEDPHYQWSFSLSFSAVRERLRRAGMRLRDLKKISVAKKSTSGRAELIRLHTSRGVVEMSGNRFRIAMGADVLRSTLFTELKQTKKGIVFKGHGWGHGVGLCQWGAYGRAVAGHSYKQILKTYYPKASLETYEAR